MRVAKRQPAARVRMFLALENVRIMKNRTVQRGFTLIELLLVLVILAVLATIVVTKFSGQSERGRRSPRRCSRSATSRPRWTRSGDSMRTLSDDRRRAQRAGRSAQRGQGLGRAVPEAEDRERSVAAPVCVQAAGRAQPQELRRVFGRAGRRRRRRRRHRQLERREVTSCAWQCDTGLRSSSWSWCW